MKFKVGQLAVSVKDGMVFQVRRVRVFNGREQIGIGKKSMCWLFADELKKYKK